jgi:hypothetical protein
LSFSLERPPIISMKLPLGEVLDDDVADDDVEDDENDD